MKHTNFFALAISLLIASIAAASAATISGSPALALAGVVAAHSPILSPAEKKTVAAIFEGRGAGPYKDEITVTADKIVCHAGNVDITVRSCEVAFGNKTAHCTVQIGPGSAEQRCTLHRVRDTRAEFLDSPTHCRHVGPRWISDAYP